nr:IS630 family transposase [Okeania sp. SIO2F4]
MLKKYNQEKEKGVKNFRKNVQKYQVGKKYLLNQEQLKKLSKELESKPKDGGIWTGLKVARWIEKETGREKIWNQRGWDYLKKHNYSWQSPGPKHRKGDKKTQEEFKINLPIKVKELKKNLQVPKVEVWFFDEHRVGLKPILRKVWSKKGERPIGIVQHRYEWLYVYGFVNPKTGETFWYLIPRVNTLWLNKVYKQFAIDVGISEEKKVLLIEDNAASA